VKLQVVYQGEFKAALKGRAKLLRRISQGNFRKLNQFGLVGKKSWK
jgi:hypothetical protein